jgi:hypothetical protein
MVVTPFSRNYREQLAVAACLNSTMLLDTVSIREQITGELEDYFEEGEPESKQFDRAATLDFIASLSDEELASLLAAMGKVPDSMEGGEKWETFVNELAAIA